MSETLLVPDGEEGRQVAVRGGAGRRSFEGRTVAVWSTVGWVGLALSAMGLADVALTWYPFDFGNPEWEFGTVSQSFNGLPSVIMGLGLWLGSAAVLERRWLARCLSVVMVLLAIAIVAAALLYATTVPMALGSVPEDAIATGLKKAITKTVAQSVLYPVIFTVVGIKGFRMAREKA